MDNKKRKALTRLERFWLVIGLLIFRVEGLPVEHRSTSSKNKGAAHLKKASAEFNHSDDHSDTRIKE